VAFEALETGLRAHALRIAASLLAAHLNRDHRDQDGAHRPCRCGARTRFAGRRARRIVSVLGPLEVVRAYYHCAACGEGFFPRDEALGIAGAHLSPGVQRMVGAVGAAVSFDEGAALLHELAGINVPARQVERYAEALGEEVARYEREAVQAPAAAPSQTMYLGQDGTGVPMRQEALQGRRGKHADGLAKTREMKLCTVWTADSRDAAGQPSRDAGSVRYSAAIESAESPDTAKRLAPFAQRVEREARRSGFATAACQVAIGDGAAWLWNIVDECFPNAIQILDKFHAKQHVHEVGKAVFGADSDLGHEWIKQRCAQLDAGQIDVLIEAIEAKSSRSDVARTCAGYFRNHRHRMDYPTFEAMGLCVGSGVVEAGCKTAIGARMKRAGMRWSERGANAIAALRCCRLSGRYDHFWRWRTSSGPLKVA
jgi:hypothetical protein